MYALTMALGIWVLLSVVYGLSDTAPSAETDHEYDAPQY